MSCQPSVTENGGDVSPPALSRVAVPTSSPENTDSLPTQVDTESQHPVLQQTDEQLSLQSSRRSSTVAESAALPNVNEPSLKSLTEAELQHAAHEPKKLIRVTADNVVTESASRSGGWFWSKTSPTHSKVVSSKNVPSSVQAVSKTSKESSSGNTKFGLVAAPGRTGVVNGSASGKGDTSDLSSSDVESVQDYSKHSASDSPVTSTPVRGNSCTERSAETQKVSSSPNSARLQADVVPSSPLSYAFMLPETSIKSSTTAVMHTSGFGSRAEFTVHNAVVTPSASGLGSTSNAEFDDGRYAMLLREKVGLEGRLEVLERENVEMLRQQAELKTRAAMAEQQIKNAESANESLMADRSAMAVDLETLRQNRSRLEVVIVDAHKLLEEKEHEVRTLERDLELARLAGEKHLEKMADVRREAASRDVTVRDLKAKITELYVQSSTLDQSRGVLEGELAAVRADVAALTEAKEWYANQLRATQKDRSRMQEETAAARAETITANVAAERLRAENARVKRNLAEVEQRVLTDKQTLARHLEEIEADMLAREAALVGRLKQSEASSPDDAVSAPSSASEVEELNGVRTELRRSGEMLEVVQRENAELARRLALSQQCVVDRDETVKALEHGRESAELRAEAAEQDAALRAADVQRLELERSELRLQLDSAGKERLLIDQSLATLRRDTAVLETSFRRMQQDLAAKTAEVEKLTSLRSLRDKHQLSEVWPDTEAAAGLKKTSETFAADGSPLSRATFADNEVQSDDISESGEVPSAQKFPAVSTTSTDTQTDESIPTVAAVTDRSEKLLTVDDVVLQSDVVDSAALTSEATVDVSGRILELPQTLSSNSQSDLERELAAKCELVDRLKEELSSVRARVSELQADLESADKVRYAEDSGERPSELKRDDLVLNTREDSFVSDFTASCDLARVHVAETHGRTGRGTDAHSQTDEAFSKTDDLPTLLAHLNTRLTALQQELDVSDMPLAVLRTRLASLRQELEEKQPFGKAETQVFSETDDLQPQLAVLKTRLAALQLELDATVDEKEQLQKAKAAVESEASSTAERLCEAEKMLRRSQDELVRLERQMVEADTKSVELLDGAVKRLEGEKVALQSQLDELTQVHQKDISRLKSKVCHRCVTFDLYCCMFLKKFKGL